MHLGRRVHPTRCSHPPPTEGDRAVAWLSIRNGKSCRRSRRESKIWSRRHPKVLSSQDPRSPCPTDSEEKEGRHPPTTPLPSEPLLVVRGRGAPSVPRVVVRPHFPARTPPPGASTPQRQDLRGTRYRRLWRHRDSTPGHYYTRGVPGRHDPTRRTTVTFLIEVELQEHLYPVGPRTVQLCTLHGYPLLLSRVGPPHFLRGP